MTQFRCGSLRNNEYGFSAVCWQGGSRTPTLLILFSVRICRESWNWQDDFRIAGIPSSVTAKETAVQQLQPYQQQKMFLYGAGTRYRSLLRGICVYYQFVSSLLFHDISLLIRTGTVVFWMCSTAFKPPLPPANFIIVLSSWVSQMPGEEPLDRALKIKRRTHFRSRTSWKAKDLSGKELENRDGEFLFIFLVTQNKKQERILQRWIRSVSPTSSQASWVPDQLNFSFAICVF